MEGVIYNVFSFKDKRLLTFSKPIITDVQKDAYVKCAVRAAVKSTDADRAYAKDQALYFLGTFDDEKAKFDLLEDPEKCVDLEDYIHDGK